MKQIFGIFFIALMCIACNNKNEKQQPDIPNAQKVDFGTLDIYPMFETKHYQARDVMVWLPEGYDTNKKYAVLYMHDGQMLFDKNTSWNKQSWNVDSVAQAVQKDGRTRPFIVVGINNHPEYRLYDYMPRKALDYIPEGDTLLAKYNINHFGADNYLRFIVDELKPFIDKNYSTATSRENTFIAGSSMGGLISMYALCEYPNIFGGAACLSTHSPLITTNAPAEVPVWAKAFRDYLNNHLPNPNTAFIYMDCGDRTIDAGYIPLQRQIDELFKAKGWGNAHFRSMFFPGHAHDENSWESRLHIPLEFIIKK